MTHIESLMLAVCFGSVVGYTISNLIIIIIIKFATDDHKEKKRRKAESADTRTSDN